MKPIGLGGNSPHVCIIGAGISGLRTADILLQEGFQVTILEARDRVGGRLHQSEKLGQLVDLGANWIHGTERNPVVDIAKATNTATAACSAVYSIFDDTGRYMEQEKARTLYETVWSILNEAYQYSAKESASIAPTARMIDFFRDRVRDDSEHDEETKRLLVQIIEMWGAFIGTECEKQSLRYFWLEEGIDGDNLFVASTYQAIVKYIASPAFDGAALSLDSEVISIRSMDEEAIEVTTASGQDIMFDAVVVTSPLGWLKHNKAAFVPPLPSRIESAIEKIGVATLEKVFVTFPKAFWSPLGGVDRFTDYGNNDYQEAATDRFPIESLFLKPTYADSTNPQQWRQEMVSLASLPQPFAHPTVYFYVYGEWGAYITRLVRGLDTESAEYYSIMQHHFEPYYSLLPRYDCGSPDCTPVAFLHSDWQNDPLAGHGSYVNFQTGIKDAAHDVESLRQGLPERRIWFAGEHTAPFTGLGTVPGAYWSGERAARQVVEAFSAPITNGDTGNHRGRRLDINEDPHRHYLRGRTPEPRA